MLPRAATLITGFPVDTGDTLWIFMSFGGDGEFFFVCVCLHLCVLVYTLAYLCPHLHHLWRYQSFISTFSSMHIVQPATSCTHEP